MIIRPYQTADCEALARLFYDTVHTVNAKSTGISREKALPLSSATGSSRLFPVSSPPTLPSPPDPFLKNGATGS